MDKSTPKHPDQVKREKVPSIDELNTKYRPLGTYMMVIPLEDVTVIGGIILPDSSRIQINEGHVVAVGANVSDEIQPGACVSWPDSTDYRMRTDDGKAFVLVAEASIIMAIPASELVSQKE